MHSISFEIPSRTPTGPLFLAFMETALLSDPSAILAEHGFTLREKLGSGRTSSVFLVESLRYSGRLFAVKQMLEAEEAESIRREFTNLSSLTHPNVIQLFEYFEHSSHFYFVLEYCSGGSVMDKIEREGALRGQELYTYCSQIVSGLAYCHSLGVAHNDVKPHNILIDDHNRCKIADFGLSQHFNRDVVSKQFLGSYAFMAPEVLNKKAFDPFRADVWSLAVTFYWMAMGDGPWERVDDLPRRVQCGLPLLPLTFDPDFRNALRMMGAPNPDRRVSLETVAAYPIFQPRKGSLLKKQASLLLPMYFSTQDEATGRESRRLRKDGVNRQSTGALPHRCRISASASRSVVGLLLPAVDASLREPAGEWDRTEQGQWQTPEIPLFQ
jgi:serine/threonine protein kinase